MARRGELKCDHGCARLHQKDIPLGEIFLLRFEKQIVKVAGVLRKIDGIKYRLPCRPTLWRCDMNFSRGISFSLNPKILILKSFQYTMVKIFKFQVVQNVFVGEGEKAVGSLIFDVNWKCINAQANRWQNFEKINQIFCGKNVLQLCRFYEKKSPRFQQNRFKILLKFQYFHKYS